MKSLTKIRLLTGAAALLFVVNAAYAVAQGSTTPTTPEASENAQSGAQKAPESLDEIMVTANKRSTSVAKTPIAITALDSTALELAGVTELKNIGEAVPNVTIRTIGYAGSIQATIRGITDTNNNPGGQPAIATYFDGVYSPRTEGLSGSLYDINRVEVLRGPQGTLYGRDSTAGNFNIFTNDPKFDTEGAASLSFGNFDDVQADVMVNSPLSNTFAVRIAGSFHENNGIYNTNPGGALVDRNYGMADDKSGRLTALWAPSSAFSWRLLVQKDHIGGTPGLDYQINANGDTLDGRNPFSNPQVQAFPSPYAQVDNLMVRSKMQLDLGNGASISYVAGYQNLTHFFRSALGGAAVALADTIRDGMDQNTYHEVNFSFENSRLFNVVGANYFNEEESFFNPAHFNQLGFSYISGSQDGRRAIGYERESSGVFDQLTFTLSPGFRLIAGARYNSETSQASLNDAIVLICPAGLTYQQLEQLLYDPSHPGCSGQVAAPARGSWSKTTWRTGFEFDLNSRSLVYGTVSTGFKSGGFNSQIAGIPPTFAPETVTNYEVGLKTKLFNNSLRLNTAAFFMDYSNLQIVQFLQASDGEPTSTTTNAAKAQIHGVEFEGQWQVTSNDRISGFLNWLDARYTTYRNTIDPYTSSPVVSLDGNHLINAPDFSTRGEYAHGFALGNGATLTPSTTVYWQSASYLREFNLPIDRVPAYAKLDGNIDYEGAGGMWNVQAFVRNAANKLVRDSANVLVPGTYLSDFEPPRTYGIRASYKF